MCKSTTKIIIIDDDSWIQKSTPWIVELSDEFPNIDISHDPNEAIEIIKSHLDENMIVILDLGFSNKMIDGHEILNRIRDLSFLIPVIIWSGKDEDKEKFADLIKNRAYIFLKKSASNTDLVNAVENAYNSMKNDISYAIEEWIKQHPKDVADKPFMITSRGKRYSLYDILKEIRLQTDFGKDIERKINKLTIDLLMRNKESLE